jgi:hypothetical protein
MELGLELRTSEEMFCRETPISMQGLTDRHRAREQTSESLAFHPEQVQGQQRNENGYAQDSFSFGHENVEGKDVYDNRPEHKQPEAARAGNSDKNASDHLENFDECHVTGRHERAHEHRNRRTFGRRGRLNQIEQDHHSRHNEEQTQQDARDDRRIFFHGCAFSFSVRLRLRPEFGKKLSELIWRRRILHSTPDFEQSKVVVLRNEDGKDGKLDVTHPPQIFWQIGPPARTK